MNLYNKDEVTELMLVVSDLYVEVLTDRIGRVAAKSIEAEVAGRLDTINELYRMTH